MKMILTKDDTKNVYTPECSDIENGRVVLAYWPYCKECKKTILVRFRRAICLLWVWINRMG